MNDLNEAVVAETPSNTPRGGLVAAAARPAEVLLGLAFLTSAILKAADINAFIVAIGLYGIVTGNTLQTASALGTLALETALGMALVLGWRPRALTLGLTTAVLLGFSGLIVYGWIAHGISDCGCLGRVKMGPGASLVKNAVLLALCLTAALGFRAGSMAGRGGIAKTIAACLCAVAVAGYSYAQIEPLPAPPTPESGPFAQFVFDVDGKKTDLGKGEYLVALLSTTCEDCMASVEKLNQLASLPGFPPIVGLCLGEEQALKEFTLITGPQFPTHLIETRLFFSLIGKLPPRFVLIRDGKPIQTWDMEVPSPEQVGKARRAASGAPS